MVTRVERVQIRDIRYNRYSKLPSEMRLYAKFASGSRSPLSRVTFVLFFPGWTEYAVVDGRQCGLCTLSEESQQGDGSDADLTLVIAEAIVIVKDLALFNA